MPESGLRCIEIIQEWLSVVCAWNIIKIGHEHVVISVLKSGYISVQIRYGGIYIWSVLFVRWMCEIHITELLLIISVCAFHQSPVEKGRYIFKAYRSDINR